MLFLKLFRKKFYINKNAFILFTINRLDEYHNALHQVPNVHQVTEHAITITVLLCKDLPTVIY